MLLNFIASIANHYLVRVIPIQYMALAVAVASFIIALDHIAAVNPKWKGNSTFQVINKDVIPFLVKFAALSTGLPPKDQSDIKNTQGPENDKVSK